MEDLVQLDAISGFIQAAMPTSTVALLNLPEVPESDLFVVLNPLPDEKIVNGMHTEIVMQWRILYFHSHAARTVEGMAKIRKTFVHGLTIPFTDPDGQMWYIRVRGFNSGEMNENQSDLNYIMGVLETVTKGIRSVEQYDLMQEMVTNLVYPQVMSDLTHDHIEGQSFDKLDALNIKEE